jgi:hypothetical protein
MEALLVGVVGMAEPDCRQAHQIVCACVHDWLLS